MNFVSIDFETANSHRTSACSLGITVVENGVIVEKKQWLIKPPRNYFNDKNIAVHGITPEMTINELEFNELWPEIKPYLHNKLLVAYNGNSMDFNILKKTLIHYEIDYDESNYKEVDVLRLVKHLFSHVKDYKLTTISSILGLKIESLNHHNSLYDSLLLAEVILKLKEHFNLTNELEIDWDFNKNKSEPKIAKSKINIDLSTLEERKVSADYRVKNIDIDDKTHLFYDKKVVITGTFDKYPIRDEIAKLLHSVGADVNSSISKKTDFVIVGKNAGPKKLEKIQDLNINIISEEEFIKHFTNE